MAGCRNLCCAGLKGLPRLLGRGAQAQEKRGLGLKEKEAKDENSVAGANTSTEAHEGNASEASEFCGFLSKPEFCPIQATGPPTGGKKLPECGARGQGGRTWDLGPCKVQPQNIARYSLPEEALSYVPEETAVVMPFANGDKERLISCNIETGPFSSC